MENNIKQIKTMEITYRLEFNEKQQHFHLDNYTHEQNTNGWFTITENCTDFEFKIFKAYVNRIKKGKLTKEYLLKSKSEVIVLLENLYESNLRLDVLNNNGIQLDVQKEYLINTIKEEIERCKLYEESIEFNHSASVFFLISTGCFLFEDKTIDPIVIYSLLEDGILKYKKRQKHQGLDSLRYVI
jgi:hypothetical protein